MQMIFLLCLLWVILYGNTADIVHDRNPIQKYTKASYKKRVLSLKATDWWHYFYRSFLQHAAYFLYKPQQEKSLKKIAPKLKSQWQFKYK